ncbi:uncharacterized protein LOC143208554 [Lasioglossum baleicum]|uniref:uncharacterized protein LOC143208554 n=1 Tax=Lasioglossum baleicum TaxID=434251 RepID=UPI003FCEC1AF
MDTKYKNIAWSEIAKEVGVPADNCKKRWQNIRCGYRKHRARDNATRSGQAASSERPYKFGNSLDFLSPSFEERAMLSSLDEEENSGTSQEVTAATTVSQDTDSGFLSQEVTAATTASQDTASGFLTEGEEDDCEPPPKRGRTGGDVSDTINRCANLLERSMKGYDQNMSQAFKDKVMLVRFFKTMALEVCELSRSTQDAIEMNVLRDISEKRYADERKRDLHDSE